MSRKLSLLLLGLTLVLIPGFTVQGDDWRERKRRIQEMSPQEKQELQRREERFRSMGETEQQRLREFHTAIEEAPDRELLESVMDRYHSWLSGLRPGQRADLLDLPPEERLERIREILEAQAVQRFHRFAEDQLDSDDRRTINEWLRRVQKQHEEEILERFTERHRGMIERLSENPIRYRESIYFGLGRIPPQEWDFLSPELVDDLKSKLSSKAREALDSERDPRKRVELVGLWARAASFSRRGWQPPVSEEELFKFFHDHVSAEDRARLETLPTEQLRSELERRYHMYQWYHGGRFRGGGRRDEGASGRRGRSGPPRPPFTQSPSRSQDRSDDSRSDNDG
jgi:hypothetical protein